MGGARPQTILERPELRVAFRRASDEQAAITRAWTEFEQAVRSRRGRKFYGMFDPTSHEYRACVELVPEDAPETLGLEVGVLPGGRYVRQRLRGEPPSVYSLIAPSFERLAQRPDCDPARPSIEFYRRHDVIDLLQPVL